MFSTPVARNIGLQNLEAAERLLDDLNIPVIARECGGEKGRRMSLDTFTGVVVIEVVGFDPIQL